MLRLAEARVVARRSLIIIRRRFEGVMILPAVRLRVLLGPGEGCGGGGGGDWWNNLGHDGQKNP
jgi:hypothetical protein